jgi:hypothetical protein
MSLPKIRTIDEKSNATIQKTLKEAVAAKKKGESAKVKGKLWAVRELKKKLWAMAVKSCRSASGTKKRKTEKGGRRRRSRRRR